MIFLKNIVEINWNAKKLFNSRRVYTWNKFKKFFKKCIDKAKTFYANIYNKWFKYIQYDNQDIKSYNEKRIHYIFILFKTFKFIVEQKFKEFEKSLKKQHKKDLKYFFKFVNKIDLITQVKRFENQSKKQKQNNKKNRKHKRNFDIFEFKFKSKKFKKNNKKKYQSTYILFRYAHISIRRAHISRLKILSTLSIFASRFSLKVSCDNCSRIDHELHRCIITFEMILIIFNKRISTIQ